MQSFDPNYGEKLFVGNLPCNTTETELWNLFSTFGAVLEVVVLGASRSKSGQACAFVRFGDHEHAVNAINSLHGRVALRPQDDPNLFLQVRPAKNSSSHVPANAITQSALPLAKGYVTYDNFSREAIPQLYSNSKYSSSPYPTGAVVNVGESVRLFIGNVPIGTTGEELNELFRSVGVFTYETETFMMNGNKNSHNSVCSFVVVKSMEDARKAIEILSGKVSVRPGTAHIVVKVANSGNMSTACSSCSSIYDNSKIQYGSWPTTTAFPSDYSLSNSNGQRMYQPLYSDEYSEWKEPSLKTYHQYMMLPQSSHYGPLNIIPGGEPWRNNGVYSLPPSSSYATYLGH